jgi:hypothetical protein
MHLWHDHVLRETRRCFEEYKVPRRRRRELKRA